MDGRRVAEAAKVSEEALHFGTVEEDGDEPQAPFATGAHESASMPKERRISAAQAASRQSGRGALVRGGLPTRRVAPSCARRDGVGCAIVPALNCSRHGLSRDIVCRDQPTSFKGWRFV